MTHLWLEELRARLNRRYGVGLRPAPFIVPPGFIEQEERMRKACNMQPSNLPTSNQPAITIAIDDTMKELNVKADLRVSPNYQYEVKGSDGSVTTKDSGVAIIIDDPMKPEQLNDAERENKIRELLGSRNVLPDACAEALSLAGVYDHVSPRFVDEDGVEVDMTEDDYPEETPIHLTRAIKETTEAAQSLVHAASQDLSKVITELHSVERQRDAFELTARFQGQKLARIADVFGNPSYGTMFKEPQKALEVIRTILLERRETQVIEGWTNVLPVTRGQLTLGEFRKWAQCLPDETPLECDGFEADGAAFLDGAITLFQR